MNTPDVDVYFGILRFSNNPELDRDNTAPQPNFTLMSQCRSAVQHIFTAYRIRLRHQCQRIPCADPFAVPVRIEGHHFSRFVAAIVLIVKTRPFPSIHLFADLDSDLVEANTCFVRNSVCVDIQNGPGRGNIGCNTETEPFLGVVSPVQ